MVKAGILLSLKSLQKVDHFNYENREAFAVIKNYTKCHSQPSIGVRISPSQRRAVMLNHVLNLFQYRFSIANYCRITKITNPPSKTTSVYNTRYTNFAQKNTLNIR